MTIADALTSVPLKSISVLFSSFVLGLQDFKVTGQEAFIYFYPPQYVSLETNPASLARYSVCEPLTYLTSEKIVSLHKQLLVEAIDGQDRQEHMVAVLAKCN
jgi:hypothetical protein